MFNLYNEVIAKKRGRRTAAINLSIQVALNHIAITTTGLQKLFLGSNIPAPSTSSMQHSANVVSEIIEEYNQKDLAQKGKLLKEINILRDFDFPPPLGYDFLNLLGAGGCGKVYFARNCSDGFECAVKCVKIIDTYPYTALLADALWREINLLKDKPHPNIIEYYGARQSTDLSIRYIFMEYMEMGSVRHLYSNPTIFKNESLVRECIYQVLNGLVHLHDVGIIHRDLKGDNVLKSERVYKIADFGLSKRSNLDSSSGIYSLMTAGVGTPSHMAPEVRNPTLNVQYDTKADIWSLGCLVLEISSSGQLKVDVDTHLYSDPPLMSKPGVNFIRRCLQVNPANRPTSSMLLNDAWFKM